MKTSVFVQVQVPEGLYSIVGVVGVQAQEASDKCQAAFLRFCKFHFFLSYYTIAVTYIFVICNANAEFRSLKIASKHYFEYKNNKSFAKTTTYMDVLVHICINFIKKALLYG
jgi:hypothetical protein